MRRLYLFFITLFCVAGMQTTASTTLVKARSQKRLIKVWHVQVPRATGAPLVYVVRSDPPQIRIFAAHTRYHHPLSLASFGVNKITDVGLESSAKEQGQILYLADKTTQRVLSIELGTKEVKALPPAPTLQAYREFIARLHPVAESERPA
jgi:hypothetical protein